MDKDKLIRLQIARTGTFGADGRTIVRQDLQDVLDTFDGKAPISLGHYAARQDWMPSWGNVENLMLEAGDGEEATLVADISIRDVLWDAIKSGFYPGWSVSIPTKPDGKHYLHHLAFLGAMPPAIRDLKIIETADGDMPEGSIKISGEPGFNYSDQVLFCSSDFSDEPKELDIKPETAKEEVKDGREEPGEEKGSKEDNREGSKKEEKNEDKTDQGFSDNGNKAFLEKARKVYSSSVKAKLDKAVEGRLPAAMKDKVHEFADLALSSWDFADAEEEPRIITLFEEILSSISALPKPGRMNFSDEERDVGKVDVSNLANKF